MCVCQCSLYKAIPSQLTPLMPIRNHQTNPVCFQRLYFVFQVYINKPAPKNKHTTSPLLKSLSTLINKALSWSKVHITHKCNNWNSLFTRFKSLTDYIHILSIRNCIATQCTDEKHFILLYSQHAPTHAMAMFDNADNSNVVK